MTKTTLYRNKFTFQLLFAILIIGTLSIGCDQKQDSEAIDLAETVSTDSIEKHNSVNEITKRLPKMVDLGADKCVPCKAMAPILVELREEYKGKVDVEFIDVWKDPAPGKEAGIRMIPTQIFYDTTGAERFRHEGFYSKTDILSKWKELGFGLGHLN
jgi:thioredoxin 1